MGDADNRRGTQQLPGPYEHESKATTLRIYERIYVLYLRINATMILLMGIGSSFGAIFIISQEYYLISVGEKKPFVYGVAFLLGCNLLGFISAVLSCAITRTHGKALLTVFVGHVLAIGLVISGLIVMEKYLSKLEGDFLDQRSPVTGDFFATINKSTHRSNWLTIHEKLNCCGIRSVDEFLKRANTSAEGFHLTSVNFETHEPAGNVTILGENSNVIAVTVRLTDENLTVAAVGQILRDMLTLDGINLDLCADIEHTAHRSCSRSLLGVLESKATLLKLCCNLMLPMLIIADILCAIGYFCFNDIQIRLPLSHLKRNKNG